ncbi:PGN_0703 family putative restriction endonuclease [Reyranella sp.]|uniref:PGN_0703 family putative restriction endonuclease n=1 Tax=Reyranella sp. TaxID=1929291 RepID=UPI003784C87B
MATPDIDPLILTDNASMKIDLLPGVPRAHVLARLAKAGGNEVKSGKLMSPESSAALAVNVFGWFVERRESLPPLPGMRAGDAPLMVEVEYCARFPWSGGRHPWLDAVIETEHQLIGVESKRFEPFRGTKAPSLSDAYNRNVWGSKMGPFEVMRDALRAGREKFEFLDATQLIKHAFGLVTDGKRKQKTPMLLYIFAEPASLAAKPIPPTSFQQHRAEVQRFAEAVKDAEVGFHAISYREWLSSWPSPPDPVGIHAKAVMERFAP